MVGLLTEWMRGNVREERGKDTDLGGSMRLGAYDCDLLDGSRVREIYGTAQISERHRHRYEVNNTYLARLEAAGLRFSGISPDKKPARNYRDPGAPLGSSGCSSIRS